ncbi:MAG: BNR repeat-containing protein [Actinobacteria bacterium]|nr:BNR repeat-containing protein [Actinomycetota bacterium]
MAPNGRVDVTWWDTRDDPGVYGNDVYYAASDDNGKTWSKNIRVTDRTIDRRIGVWGFNFDMSSPPGLASTDEFALLAWDDTRNADPTKPDSVALGGGLQDIYTSAIQYEAVGGGASRTAQYALAGVVGLLVVGLALTVVALAARRRDGTPPPTIREASDQESAGVG